MGSTGLGLVIEEHRGEIAVAWKAAVEAELGGKDAALGFAVAPLLREMSRAMTPPADASRWKDAWIRCAVLVRSTASAPQLAREFMLLHRCTWDALRARGVAVSSSERTRIDEWMHQALAEALERLERVRLRGAAYAQTQAMVPALAAKAAARPRPPPLPRSAARPATAAAGAPRATVPADGGPRAPAAARPVAPPPLPKARAVPPPLPKAPVRPVDPAVILELEPIAP